MGTQAQGEGGDSVAPEARPAGVEASSPVLHQVSSTLWLFEDQSGQLYIAVKTPRFKPGPYATYTGQTPL